MTTPRNKGVVTDLLIAAAFITMGIFSPGDLFNNPPEHIGGLAMGLGIGWLIRSFISSKGETKNA